jgi:pimeloyl-ACP methyl ester carboxylesterase
MKVSEEKKIVNKGCEVYYWVCKAKEKENNNKWIIFLHGAGLDHEMFHKQLEVIPDTYNILRWDARGHGMSVPVGDDFSVHIMLEDLLIMMKNEKIKEAIFVGHSMGGNIAQQFLYFYPENVSALVLIGCMDQTRVLTKKDKYLFKIAPYLLKWCPWEKIISIGSHACSVKPETKIYIAKHYYNMGKELFTKVFLESITSVQEDPDYRINKPLLVLCGKKDRLPGIKKAAPKWLKRNKKCKVYMIEDAGHNANQDNPEKTNEILLEFIKNYNI